MTSTDTRRRIELQDCATCGKPASETRSGYHAEVRDPDGTRYAQCVECWNASVEEYRRQRKAELAARPKCEACGRKPRTYVLAGSDAQVSLCGTCRNRVNRVIRAPMLFGPPSASRARILEVARG
jgi:hypothetical protein